MRLFIALDCEEIGDCIESLKKGIVQPGVATSVGAHLTLWFLGEVSEDVMKALVKKLRTVSFKPFQIETAGVGFFPNASNPRVVWIGIEECPAVMKLQKDVDDALDGFGFKKDFRFHPHITLGRVRFVHDKKEFMKKVESLPIEKKTVEVASFKLMKSTLTPQGPVYEVEEEFLGEG